MSRSPRVPTFRLCVALLALALTAAACGSRRPVDEIAAAAGGVPAGTAAALEAGEDAVDGAPVALVDPARAGAGGGGRAAVSGTPGTTTITPPGTSGTTGSAAPSARQPGAGTPAQPGAAAPAADKQTPDQRGSSPVQGPARRPRAARSPGSTMRIGVVGTLSGVGGTQRGSAAAVQAWAQWRNEVHGGINGHPVEVLVVDDGGDPSRFSAALRELVEQRGVVAFVGNPSGFTLTQGAVDYLESKGVPVVGGDRLGPLWNASPMMFPQASAGDAVIWNHMVNVRRIGGPGAAVGWVSCQEAQICRDADRLWQQYAPKLGLEVKYRAQVSVAQPNFTSECTRAMQAGVKLFVLGTDANSIRRLANDCARQGYRPKFGVLQTSDDQASEPALADGFFASATFPWVRSNTPATKLFHSVMSTYAPQVELSAHASSGWVAAKLFERAARNVSAKPTAKEIAEGLWSIRGEDLGGLTSALTFFRGKPARHQHCFFSMRIAGGRWATESDRLRCRAP